MYRCHTIYVIEIFSRRIIYSISPLPVPAQPVMGMDGAKMGRLLLRLEKGAGTHETNKKYFSQNSSCLSVYSGNLNIPDLPGYILLTSKGSTKYI